MKNLLIVLLLLFTGALNAQNFPELIRAYKQECDLIVNDTVEQTGLINYDLVPVKDGDEIKHYALSNPDTTWNKVDCPEYKYQLLRWRISNNDYGTTTFTSLDNNIYVLANGHIPNTEVTEKTSINITRNYVCECKTREVEPWSNHFWEWLRNIQ